MVVHQNGPFLVIVDINEEGFLHSELWLSKKDEHWLRDVLNQREKNLGVLTQPCDMIEG